MSEEELTIWTVGHSTRTLGEFIELLTVNEIEALADVRRFPASRKHPHFDQDALRTSLPGVGVEYVPLPELGGRRRPRPDSQNTVWRNESFRGYADYMETEGFHRATVGAGPSEADGRHVRGSGLVEVSSVTNCRLPEGGGSLCAAYD